MKYYRIRRIADENIDGKHLKRYMIRRVNDGIEDELFSRIEKLGFTLKRKGNDYLDKYRLDSEWTSDFKIRNEEEMNKVGAEIDNIVDEYDDIHNSITYNLAVDRNGVGHLNLDIRDKGSRHKNTRDSAGKYTDFSTHYLKRGGRNSNNHIHKELLDSEDKANMVDTDSIEFNYNDFGGVRVSFYYYDSNGDKDYFESNNIIAEDKMEEVDMAMRELNRLSGKTDRHGYSISPVHFSEDEYARVADYIGEKYQLI